MLMSLDNKFEQSLNAILLLFITLTYFVILKFFEIEVQNWAKISNCY